MPLSPAHSELLDIVVEALVRAALADESNETPAEQDETPAEETACSA